MTIAIRKIHEKDFEELNKLYTTTVLEDFYEYSEKIRKRFVQDPYKRNIFTSSIKYGAFVEDRLVGYLFAYKPMGGILFCSWLAIHTDYRGQGIGKKLLKKLEENAKKLHVHSIHLFSDQRNITFYEKCGYEVYGIDKQGFFGSDDYLMKKKIQEPQEDYFFT